MAKMRQISKKELLPLIKSLYRMSRFLETATDCYSIEYATISEHHRVGVLFEFIAGDEDGNEIDLQLWNLEGNPVQYGVGEKRSKFIKDWLDFGVRGDAQFLLPLYKEVINQLYLLKLPVSSISWDVLGGSRGILDKFEIRKNQNKPGEYNLIIGVKTPEGE